MGKVMTRITDEDAKTNLDGYARIQTDKSKLDVQAPLHSVYALGVMRYSTTNEVAAIGFKQGWNNRHTASMKNWPA